MIRKVMEIHFHLYEIQIMQLLFSPMFASAIWIGGGSVSLLLVIVVVVLLLRR